MPLTLEQLQDIQAEAMADDIDIDMERMALWTEEHARKFFETGEEPLPEWQPDPYFMRKLEENELNHLCEMLCVEKKQSVAGLVDLIRTDRPKFLPTLKELGVAKLPERQKLRDIINAIANPPKGSADDLRDQYKEELKTWPYAVVQGEKYICASDVDTMVQELPTNREALRQYRVKAQGGHDQQNGIALRKRRAQNSGPSNSALPNIKDGEVISGDDVSWDDTDPYLCVHVYLPNVVMPSMGFVQGWLNFTDLVPLDEDGQPRYQKESVATFAIQRQIQIFFEEVRASPL